MRVCAITCTAGRYSCLARNVRMFLEQDYENKVQLVFQNSPNRLEFPPIEEGFTGVILVNKSIDSVTGRPYETLGAIYRDALMYVPKDVDVINHMDDDDLFLPNHISEGVKGMIRGGKSAYKPQKSWFLSGNHEKSLIENTLEPSIFVKKSHIDKYGYGQETSAQHLQWVNPLVYENDIFCDPEGPPTMLYDWNTTGIGVYKTSGNAANPENMNNYREFSQDFGGGVLKPITKAMVQKYYNLINR